MGKFLDFPGYTQIGDDRNSEYGHIHLVGGDHLRNSGHAHSITTDEFVEKLRTAKPVYDLRTMEIYVAWDEAVKVWDALMANGGEFGLRPTGMGVYAVSGRIEKLMSMERPLTQCRSCRRAGRVA